MQAYGLQQGLQGCLARTREIHRSSCQSCANTLALRSRQHARRSHVAVSAAERDLNGITANGASSNGAPMNGAGLNGNGAMPAGEHIQAHSRLQGLGEASNISAKLMPFLLRLAHITWGSYRDVFAVNSPSPYMSCQCIRECTRVRNMQGVSARFMHASSSSRAALLTLRRCKAEGVHSDDALEQSAVGLTLWKV